MQYSKNYKSQCDDKEVPELDRHRYERVKGPVLFFAAFSRNSRFSRGWMIGMHAKSNLQIKKQKDYHLNKTSNTNYFCWILFLQAEKTVLSATQVFTRTPSKWAVQFIPLTECIIRGTWRMNQRRYSSSLLCIRPQWEVLAWIRMSAILCRPFNICSA